MTMAETVELNIEDEDAPPDNAVAFTVQATSTFVRQGFLNRMPSRVHPKIQCNDKAFGVSENTSPLNFQSVLHRFRTLIRPTTSEKDDTTRIDKIDPLIQEVTRNKQPDESVLFASQGTFGIVDLGASLSVTGKHQFEELCQSLPHQILSGMKEAPCAVNFRFGNDSTVIGDRAVYFPVQQYWIKVVIVPSNTPFLIANSVFRSLGAVIDTEDNTVFFKKLHRRIPITLTDRKLYRLDFAELLTGSDPSSEQNPGPELICQTTTDAQGFDKQVESQGFDKQVDPKKVDKPNGIENSVKVTLSEKEMTSLQTESRVKDSSLQSLKPEPWFENSPPSDRSCVHRETQHVAEPVREVGRSSPSIDCDREPRGRSPRGHHANDLYAELKDHPMDFGKAHVGKKFSEMVTNTKYVTWFVDSYKHSQKPTHLRFLRFVSLHVEQLERNQEKTKEKLGARSKAMPKTRSSPVPENDNFPGEQPSESDFEAEAWDQVPEANNLEFLQMQDRLQQMENAMAQVLDHLSKADAHRANSST